MGAREPVDFPGAGCRVRLSQATTSSDGISMIFVSSSQDLGNGKSASAFWRAQVVGWIFLALVGFFIRLVVFGSATAAFWLTIALEPLAFGLTSMAAVMHGRRTIKTGWPTLICAVFLCLAASALLAAIAYAVHQLFPPGSLQVINGNQYTLGFIYYLGILSIWTLVYFGVAAELAARTERMFKMNAETRALRLELEHLQRQIEPHFLFNALNTIVAEIADRPAIAEEMTRRLADYLRYSLDRRGSGLSLLEQELEAADTYVRIQALRFDRHFEFRCHIDPASLDVYVPHMTLQGLVENAIKHGMRSEHGRFHIGIRTRMQGNELIIEVDNPGQLHAPYDLAHGGGLGNLCRRLALRYPDRYDFSLDQRKNRIVAKIKVWGEPET